MNDIELQLAGKNIDISPVLIPDLYAGEPLIVAIRADDLPEQIILRGQRQGETWQQTVPLALASEGGGIHVVWARKKIESLLDERAMQRDDESREDLRHQVVDIALNHHLVTLFTSLVAVDQVSIRPELEAIDNHPINSNVPKGTQFGLARTATGMTYFIGTGFVVLIFALALLWLSQPYSQNVRPDLC
ncbi:MAG: hypothetical protein AB9Q22_09035 [Candidatus Reddybacter sp.]